MLIFDPIKGPNGMPFFMFSKIKFLILRLKAGAKPLLEGSSVDADHVELLSRDCEVLVILAMIYVCKL